MFRDLLGANMTDAEELRAAMTRKGLSRPGSNESWEDLFFRSCIEAIEPETARLGACFMTGFPAILGTMARRRESDPENLERFEGYIDGVELVNGYRELTDPMEQEERLMELSRRFGDGTLPVDRSFIDALRHGLPDCSGAALGADRLVILLLGKNSIADIMYL
jgi:lysyl-tRNA synthetase class 2